MSASPKDKNQRQQATDPSQSFIVQAPAGSGKTEILTQRFLRLLACVESPEQIVALTFTRKAASEMRERIIMALEKAALGIEPQSAHQQQTFDYAKKVLARDQQLKWQLLSQPSRLRISTIDSLCQRLVQAIPLQENQVAYSEITDKPALLYRKAAEACLDFALQTPDCQQALRDLLFHLDNQQERLLSLFCDLLTQRDQWLLPLHQAKFQDKNQFEQAIAWIEHHELTRFKESLDSTSQSELMCLLRRFASLEKAPESIQTIFQNWSDFNALDRDKAALLSQTLLTTQGKLRKRLDHNVKLTKDMCSKEMYQSLKKDSEALFEKLNQTQDFTEALKRIKILPPPTYEPRQWDVLQALFKLLPLLAAHLQLIFHEHNSVDFAAIAQLALDALGEEENPTDLALYLDHQIHHLLVDEFQDTSIQQFELLTKLVQGWLPDEGKTLFVVGDPMQSIYRFRSAEVGLFLRAQRHGIGSVQLTPLELTCNFRSTTTIVHWINQQFQSIFPVNDDIESGAVSFHPSDVTQSTSDMSYVTAQQYASKREAAEAIIQLVKTELASYPTEEIAILVRSRNDLQDIMSLLRSEGIAFQGVDIDPLTNLPHLMDVWSLTQALLMPSNRLAWLAFLRSPWCGLSLADLHTLANIDKKKSILWALEKAPTLPELSESGKLRCQFLYSVFQHALRTRCQYGLSEWIFCTLSTLQTQLVLTEDEQADLEQFWYLLDQFEENGQLGNWQIIQEEFSKLYSKRVTPSRLKIMTIHKSKGLEFDAVILPSLSTRASHSTKPLLRWLKLPTEVDNLLLVSPVKASYQTESLLFDYLEKLDREKDYYETQRLLYVAATRAKKRLHLFDHRDKGSDGTFRQLLNRVSFDTLEETSDTTHIPVSPVPKPPLYQLPDSYYQKPPAFSAGAYSNLKLSDDSGEARLVGIAAHELLQWICNNKPSHVDEIPWSIASALFRQNGIAIDKHTTLINGIKTQILRLMNDPVGQWLIQPHSEESNEYELFIQENDELKTRIIDRTFVDKGVRWIIDYKTGREDQTSTKHHQEQVNGYASLLTQRSDLPIRCGLYYLASGHWIEWEYEIDLR